MAATGTIIIQIDDSQLQAVLGTLDEIAVKTTTTIGSTTGRRGSLASSLPGVNREMRIILGQIPGMRQALSLFFNLKRVERGILRDAGVPSFHTYLALLSVVILTLRMVLAYHERMKRRRREYELFVRRELELSREQYQTWQAEWKNNLRNMPG